MKLQLPCSVLKLIVKKKIKGDGSFQGGRWADYKYFATNIVWKHHSERFLHPGRIAGATLNPATAPEAGFSVWGGIWALPHLLDL